MDRPIAIEDLRRARLAQVVRIVVPVTALVALIVVLPGWMRPSIRRDQIRTALVTQGPIESAISATGTVVPEIERVLSSPFDARVLRILRRPGAAVRQSEPVVQLDVSQSALELARVVKESKVKDNQQAQVRLALDRTLRELDGRIELKTVEVDSLQTRRDSQRQLFDGGLVSRDALRQAELDLKQAEVARAQLESDRVNAQRATALQVEGLGLERESIDREIAEARHLLDLATTNADRDGVVTWVIPQEGALVRRGDVIARIADLTSFRVDAVVSDVHAARIHPGVPVIVKVNDTDLSGAIASVHPTIESGTMTFTVSLDHPSHAALRPSQRVDVLVVTDRKARALRVSRGPFADGAGTQQVFVIRGGRAIRTPIQLGLASLDEVEVTSGLREGDEMVTSDMHAYLHLKEITLK